MQNSQKGFPNPTYLKMHTNINETVQRIINDNLKRSLTCNDKLHSKYGSSDKKRTIAERTPEMAKAKILEYITFNNNVLQIFYEYEHRH